MESMVWEFGLIMMLLYKYYHFWGFTSQLIIVIPEKYGLGENWQV